MRKKIGILTFHYVTNYGAVLQCYALQTILKNQGYEPEVINYKPRRQEDNLYNFFRFRKYRNLASYISTRKREQQLARFRSKRLTMNPKKLRTMAKLQRYVQDYDVLISGSDQVLNPSALLYGEAYGGKGFPCPVYFLGFPFSGKKIGYALSFGVTQYPEPQLSIARKYVHSFDKLSVRENTGIDIVECMGRTDAVVMPDPTLLHEPSFYHELADDVDIKHRESFIFCFFLRDIVYSQTQLAKVCTEKCMLWNNDDGEYSLEGWLNKIKHSDFVITDSFHCMVMCLKLHTPFAVMTALEGKQGMNDRLYTILEFLGMEERIVYREDVNRISELLLSPCSVKWEEIDTKLAEYARSGILFLNEI